MCNRSTNTCWIRCCFYECLTSYKWIGLNKKIQRISCGTHSTRINGIYKYAIITTYTRGYSLRAIRIDQWKRYSRYISRPSKGIKRFSRSSKLHIQCCQIHGWTLTDSQGISCTIPSTYDRVRGCQRQCNRSSRAPAA